MQPLIVALGILFVVVGAVSIRFPHRVRNYVSAREWQSNTERAEQKQELYARIIGFFLVFGLGCMCIFVGVVI